jgi:hypothetical protein
MAAGSNHDMLQTLIADMAVRLDLQLKSARPINH